MLVVFFKSVITFFIVFIIVRLMGKREIGEMQPFELVITLIIAEVACIPMNDPYIPFYAGIVPIVTLAFLQILVSFLSRKFLTIRKWTSGTSIIVIDKNGVNYTNLSKLNMNVNDLIGSMRSGGVSDILDVMYAIVETSGKISVVKKAGVDDKTEVYLPLTLIVNGVWEEENLQLAQIEKVNLLQAVKTRGIRSEKDVVYCDVRQDGTVFISQKRGSDFSLKVDIRGGESW